MSKILGLFVAVVVLGTLVGACTPNQAPSKTPRTSVCYASPGPLVVPCHDGVSKPQRRH